MKTTEYRTRTIFLPSKNPNFNEKYWPIALDFGYSAVKGFCPDMVFSFPSYARRVESVIGVFGKPDDSEIYFRDSMTNEMWIVGAKAQAMVTIGSTNDSLLSLFGRNRYFSDIFRVCSLVGMAVALRGKPNGKIPKIQTGLPPQYLASDKEMLIESLSGHNKFEIKIGSGKWEAFEFDFGKDDFDKVMPQPMGTYFSVITGANGLPVSNMDQYTHSSTLIVDAGFGTLDLYYLQNNTPSLEPQTFSDLGMKQVLQNTSNAIAQEMGVEISVAAMQNYLEHGTVPKANLRTMKSEICDFAPILERESKKVCMQAIKRIMQLYNLAGINNIVITGGTCAAWSNYIRDYLKDMETINIISGNANSDLPFIFSNVRGYYHFLVTRLRAAA